MKTINYNQMKARNTFILAALATTMLAACQQNEVPATADGKVPMTFTADIEGARTRATETAFESGDQIGIFALPSAESTTPEEGKANLCYTGGTDGSSFSSTAPYYFTTADPVTFRAYYPYSDALTADDSYLITLDTRAANQAEETLASQHTWRKNDLLATMATASRETPNISYTGTSAFSHVMTRLVMTFKAELGVDLAELTGYTLGNFVMDGTFNPLKGLVTLTDGAAAESLTMTDTEIPLILLPQTIANNSLELKVTCGGKTYATSLTVPAEGLEAGKSYTCTVTLKASDVEATMAASAITAWSETPLGDAEAKSILGTKTLAEAVVGDYCLSDGSFMGNDEIPTTEQSNARVGAVFYVGHHENDHSDYSQTGIGQEKCHVYVVALRTAQCEWGPTDISFEFAVASGADAVNDWDGYDHTQQIIAAAGGKDQLNADNAAGYPATYYATVAYPTVTYPTHSTVAPAMSSGWFLPSAGQVFEFFNDDEVKSDFSVYDALGGIGYWTSSVPENDNQSYLMSGSSNLFNKAGVASRTNGQLVRPIFAL